MFTVTAFRYENADGIGPYISGFARANGLNVEHTSRHPSNELLEYPTGLLQRPTEHLCCCWIDYRQLCRWFTPMERRKLTTGGFKLLRYKVPSEHIWFDSRQGVFDKRFAELVK